MKYFLIFWFFFIAGTLFSQVQIDKNIQLTGSGSDAKISGIEEISSPEDAVSAEAEQKNQLTYAGATNVGNDLSITLSPAITAYTTGMMLHFLCPVDITGSTTLNVNSVGAIAIKKNFNSDLASGDLKSGQMVSVIYDGTNFQMISQLATAPSAGLSAENSSNSSTWTSSNSSSDWEDITTHTHTAGQTGRYFIAASFESIDGSGGTNQLIRINANGKVSSTVSVGTYLSSFQYYTLTMLVDLNSGETVKLQNQNNWNYCCKNQVKNIKFSLIKVM
ncbi:MAG: hypothetical protein IT223_02855 [Crocinitomicaceae bacterium]|nr:hypothetical protein [Crocinitomicaceae bacterium]